jgi:hypothetical protein
MYMHIYIHTHTHIQKLETQSNATRKKLMEQEIKQAERGRTLDSAAMAEKLLKLVDEVFMCVVCVYVCVYVCVCIHMAEKLLKLSLRYWYVWFVCVCVCMYGR